MKKLSQTKQFVRDVKRIRRRGKDIEKLKVIVSRLAQGEGGSLDAKHRDHALTGMWKNCRDCHIEPDWILIYSMDRDTLRLERTGSHSDIFE